ncbi:MAG TPA: amidohydrolase family protein [Fimbriimonadaceae bacterium]|nr:amidohydrolase family protein [Fimbriimonadaceae bacterium]
MLSALVAVFSIECGFGQTKPVAIVNARIETGDGKVIPSGVVVIRDGKIVSVSEMPGNTAGDDILDAKGKTLYPGFIDGYSTRGLKLPDAPSSGSAPDSLNTAPPTMWHGNRKGIRFDVVAGKCLDLADELKDNYAQGITTALLSSGAGTIRGIASIVTYTDKGDVLVPSEAAEISIRGGGFGGGGGGGYPGSLLGIIALTRQILFDAQQYAQFPPEKKDDGFENLKPLMTKQIPALFNADTDRDIVRCGHLADEFGFKEMVCMARDAYKQIDTLKAHNAAVMASIDLGDEPSVKPPDNPTSDSAPPEVLAETHQNWVERSQNVSKLIAAGIPVAFSSTGASLGDFLKNVRKLIAAGVSRQDALKCLTSGAATILGVADKIGTIEAGKQANLVLMTGDFADANSEVDTVFVEGKLIKVKKEAGK